MTDVVFDLFGNPVRAGKGGRGRPPFEATEKERNKVKLLLSVGWSNQRIANALAVSLATLKRYFRAELKVRDQMQDRMEAARLQRAYDLADGGNVGAMRQLDRLIEKQHLAGIAKRIGAAQTGADDDDSEEAAPRRKLGKKEAAQNAAKTAGEDSEWGSDLLPGVLN